MECVIDCSGPIDYYRLIPVLKAGHNMQDVRAAREMLARRKDEISKILAEKEIECTALRAKRNALEITIADLAYSDNENEIKGSRNSRLAP